MTAPTALARARSATGSESLMAGWRYRALIWSVLLSAFGYLGLALWGGWHEVGAAMEKLGLSGLAVALLLSLANYGLRFARWQLYLRRLGHSIAWGPGLRIYLAGYALTTTPLKAGEALRGVLLKRWGIPYVDSFAAFVSERFSDLLAIMGLTLFGVTLYPASQPIVYAGAALMLAGLVVLSCRTLSSRTTTPNRSSRPFGLLLSALFDIARQTRRCHSPALLIATALISLIGWAAEALSCYLILQWIGAATPMTFVIFAFAFSTLAGALSLTPGGLGTTEAILTALLIWRGTGEADAVAATVLVRFTTLWLAVFVGLIALFHVRQRIESNC